MSDKPIKEPRPPVFDGTPGVIMRDSLEIGEPLRGEGIRGDDEIVLFDGDLLIRRPDKSRRRAWPLEGEPVWEPAPHVEPDTAQSFRPHGFVRG